MTWAILIGSAMFSAGGAVASKWILNNDVNPCTLFILLNIFYTIGACIVFLFCKNNITNLMYDIKHRIKWQHWIALVLMPIGAVALSYLFLKILRGNKVSILSPTRSIIALTLTILLGMWLLSEKILFIEGCALSAMIFGLLLLIYSAWANGNFTQC
tara:strand:- start:35 stop:505 length:471 start_codon:yes stop_codon:yes gene_type:complete